MRASTAIRAARPVNNVLSECSDGRRVGKGASRQARADNRSLLAPETWARDGGPCGPDSPFHEAKTERLRKAAPAASGAIPRTVGRGMNAVDGGERLRPDDHVAGVIGGDVTTLDLHRADLEHTARASVDGGGQQRRAHAAADGPSKSSASISARGRVSAPQRVLRELVKKKDKIRTVLPVMDAQGTGRISYQDLSEGLRSAGVMLGDADCASVWLEAGGSVCPGSSSLGAVPDGEVQIASLLARLEDGNASGVRFVQTTPAACPHHMQSSLTEGLRVRDGVPEFEATGGAGGTHLRRSFVASPTRGDGAGSRPDGDVMMALTEGYADGHGSLASPKRWRKTEEHCRQLMREKKESVKKMFLATAASEGEATMTFQDLKAGLRNIGVRLCSSDYERLWRRADTECIGLVKYDDIAKAFDLTDRRSFGEPGGSRALPHFQQPSGQASEQLPLERRAEDVVTGLAAERLARNLVGIENTPGQSARPSSSINRKGGKVHFVQNSSPKASTQPRVWDLVKDALAQHEDSELDVDALHQALNSAGALVSKADSAVLWQRASSSASKKDAGLSPARRPSPTVTDVERVVEAAANLQTPSKQHPPTALLAYGSRLPSPAPELGAAGCGGLDVEHRGGAEAMGKLLKGFLGNPCRLRQVFKKFDLDRRGSISRAEFERGLAQQWTELSAADIERLGAAAEDAYGVVPYESFCELVARRSSMEASTSPSKSRDRAPAGGRYQYAPGSPRGAMERAGPMTRPASPRGPQSPRRAAASDQPWKKAAAGIASVPIKRERSCASVRSNLSSCSVRSSFGGAGASDRSAWMTARVAASPRRQASPMQGHPAVPTEMATGNPVAGAAGTWGKASLRILHMAAGPPVAIPRSLSSSGCNEPSCPQMRV